MNDRLKPLLYISCIGTNLRRMFKSNDIVGKLSEEYLAGKFDPTGDEPTGIRVIKGPLTFLKKHEKEREYDIGDIAYGTKGKPYFIKREVEFSVSHTQLSYSGKRSDDYLWGCLIVPANMGPVGLDIQAHRPCSFMKLANRYFGLREREEILKAIEADGDSGGSRAFFRIWSRREALGKCLGTGIWLGSQETIDDDVCINGEHLRILDLDFSAGIKEGEVSSACCFVRGRVKR